MYLVYSKGGSEDLQSLRYPVLLEILDSPATFNQNSAESRKRPESSSPEKLKARNQQKYSRPASNTQQTLPAGEDEYKEEQFEQMLDKDDDEDNG